MVTRVADAVGLPFEALGLLWRERRLWGPAGVPFVLSLLAVGGALAVVVGGAEEIRAALSPWLPTVTAGAWYTWLWVGPARALLWLAEQLLFLAAAAVVLVAALLVASLLASPFHDLLARRVEEIETGAVVEAEGDGLAGAVREGLRALGQEARRLVFFALALGAVALLWLVPGGQLLAPPAMTLLAVFFLPLEYASYTLDRRRLSFREKRAWLLANRGATLGYGGAAFLVCAVPGLNLLAMPVLVVGGTLLALRNPPGAGAHASS